MRKLKFPKRFMKVMKKKKRKKIRSTPVDQEITEKKYNDAKIQL